MKLKKFLSSTLAAAMLLGGSAAFAERAVDASGDFYLEYELKTAYDEMFDMMRMPFSNFLEFLSSPNFDLHSFINSEYGQMTAKHGHIFMAYDDNMDPELLAYYREQGLEKVMFTGEDPTVFNEQFYAFIPTDLAEGETCPVVIVSHGAGATARTTELYGWTDIAAKEKLILIMTEDTSEDFLHSALDKVRAQYPVDNSRIYLTGTSMGGLASRSFAAKYPGEVAAIAPMDNSWGYYDAEKAAFEAAGITVPAIFISGTADTYHVLPVGEFESVIWASISDWNNLMDILGDENYKLTSEESKALIENSLNIVEYYTGVKVPETEVRNFVNNRAYINRFVDENGVNLLSLVVVENKPHMPVGHDVDMAWEFLSQFARNTETGELIVR